MIIKELETPRQLHYVLSSFTKSYSNNRVGKLFVDSTFFINKFLFLANEKGYRIVLLIEGHTIKSWALHSRLNVHYCVGSRENKKKIESYLDIDIKDSISAFYMPEAKGYRGD